MRKRPAPPTEEETARIAELDAAPVEVHAFSPKGRKRVPSPLPEPKETIDDPAAVKAYCEENSLKMPDGPCFINAQGQVIPEKHRGTKLYYLTRDHWRPEERYEMGAPTGRGGLMKAGETIEVTDEVPSRTWVPCDAAGTPDPKLLKKLAGDLERAEAREKRSDAEPSLSL